MVCSVYESTGRLGIIDISSPVALSVEPPSVLGVFARIRLPGQEVSVAALGAMLRSRDLKLATEQLADADVNLITFACTSGSLIHGPGWDQELVDRIETASGISATTATAAVIATLRVLGARRIGVAIPSPDDVNEAERRFLESVVHMALRWCIWKV
jgi:maleate isomerase